MAQRNALRNELSTKARRFNPIPLTLTPLTLISLPLGSLPLGSLPLSPLTLSRSRFPQLSLFY
ncbi:MAG: hypothetical protein LBB63_00355 [Holosporaceae bacterium]|jgi:hypothetical protein|nr:hypothetical protein [Holosporaceae bacterium]